MEILEGFTPTMAEPSTPSLSRDLAKLRVSLGLGGRSGAALRSRHNAGEDHTSLCDYGIIIVTITFRFHFATLTVLRHYLPSAQEVQKDQKVPDECQQDKAVTSSKINLTTYFTLHECPLCQCNPPILSARASCSNTRVSTIYQDPSEDLPPPH